MLGLALGGVVRTCRLKEPLSPRQSHLAALTRPPAGAEVRAPSEEVAPRAYLAISAKAADVRWLVGYEGTAFAFTGDTEQDLLSITAVPPTDMDEAAVDGFLTKAGLDWGFARGLQPQEKTREVGLPVSDSVLACRPSHRRRMRLNLTVWKPACTC